MPRFATAASFAKDHLPRLDFRSRSVLQLCTLHDSRLCARHSARRLVASPGRAGFVRTAIKSSGSFFSWRSLCPASPTRRQRLDYVECLQPGRATLCTFPGSWTRRQRHALVGCTFPSRKRPYSLASSPAFWILSLAGQAPPSFCQSERSARERQLDMSIAPLLSETCTRPLIQSPRPPKIRRPRPTRQPGDLQKLVAEHGRRVHEVRWLDRGETSCSLLYRSPRFACRACPQSNVL